MLTSRYSFILASACLITAIGCAQQVDRSSTPVRQVADIRISVAAGTNAAPVTPPPQAPAGQPALAARETGAPVPRPAATPEPVAAAAAPTVTTTEGPAKFVGRVVVKGTPPSLAPLVKQGQPVKDAVCSQQEVPDESVVVSADGGLANVFVYMRRPPREGIPNPSGETPQVDQKGCLFLPHAQVVRVGQEVHLKNSDPVAHNVRINGFSNSFNQTIPAGDTEGLNYQFRSPENLPARMACDFHGWMSAWILPLNHPWGAVTDAGGHFTIGNIPDGEWEFVVWHEKPGYVERAYKVAARQGQVVEKIFEVEAAKLSP